jgi:hypothetical protein
VDSGKVGILKERDEVSLGRLLECHNGGRLEAQVGLCNTSSLEFHPWNKRKGVVTDLEVLRDFTDETLEGKLPDEKFSRLLVATDLAKGDSSGTEAMGLLHTASGGLWNDGISRWHVTKG